MPPYDRIDASERRDVHCDGYTLQCIISHSLDVSF